MVEEYKVVVQPQSHLSPKMNEVIKAKVIMLLDEGIIYPILNSKWVSSTQLEPKKRKER